jgi:hypothetical protein
MTTPLVRCAGVLSAGVTAVALPADQLDLATGTAVRADTGDETEFEVPAAAAERTVEVCELAVEDGVEFDGAAVEATRQAVAD